MRRVCLALAALLTTLVVCACGHSSPQRYGSCGPILLAKHRYGCAPTPSGSAPASTAAPAVTGNTVQGDTLTASTGSWSNSPTSYAYQWQDCVGASCTNISGATGSTYTAQAPDENDSLAVTVTAHNAGGATSASSWNTSAVSPSIDPTSIVSMAYAIGYQPPTGCASWNSTCLSGLPWGGINQLDLFSYGGSSDTGPAQDATTTGATIAQGSTITSISATVSATIPAGPVMLTTDATTPSSGSYQILQTSGAASGATSIPITGSPTANAAYASGSAVMVWVPNNQNAVPSGSTLTSDVSTIHTNGAKVLIALGGSNETHWGQFCANGYEYLAGAEMSHIITANNFDGMEIDDEYSGSEPVSCFRAIADEVHATATTAGNVPIVQIDWNPTDGVPDPISTLATIKTSIDQAAFEFYGNSYDNNCSGNCVGGNNRGPAGSLFLPAVTGAGWASQKWVYITCTAGCQANSSQLATTVLGTTTAALSSGANVGSSGSGGIPISGIAAVGSGTAGSMPAGLFIIADTGSPPSTWQFLETSGVTGCTSGCTIPVTGSCTAAGWRVNTNTCTDSSTVDLNAAYASGADIYFDPVGYAGQTGLNTGGWDCGTIAAYAAANNMRGVANWYEDGAANTSLCFDATAPFATGGLG